jgi:glycosyltransferase involved in cell wall biosynthesis
MTDAEPLIDGGTDEGRRVPLVPGNDHTVLAPPEIGAWTPRLRVSVVVPTYNGQDKLDLTLAGLAAQTYPADLTEVLVVDNGSEPPLRLPGHRPAHTRLIRCPDPGRAAARNAGLAAASGDVVHWLDSDVVLDRRAVEAHMRWHHLAPYLVVTGYLRFTTAAPPAPEVIVATDDLAPLFEPAEPHAWLVDLVEGTRGLTRNPHRAFSLHVGGATSVGARLFERAGAMDADLVLGQDTEMGYRLAQAGAVFVPEPAARGYHLGPTMRMRDKPRIDRVSHAYVADRIPSYRWLRRHPTRQWRVPYVEVVVDVGGRLQASGAEGLYDEVRTTVDAVLAGTVPDVAVVLTGPWDRHDRERRAPLTDPLLDLTLIAGHYAHENRVRLARDAGETAAPYRFHLPPGWAPDEDGLARLLDLATEEGHGLVAVLLEERAEGIVAARLERTAAYARAALVLDARRAFRPTATATGTDDDLDASTAPGATPSDAATTDVSTTDAVPTDVGAGADAALRVDDVVAETFGVVWVAGEGFGFTRDPAPPLGRRSAYRARIEAQAEVARLAKEVERLRGQVTRWRDEAGKWRGTAVELRREVGTLRKDLAAARKAVRQATRSTRARLASSIRRALDGGRTATRGSADAEPGADAAEKGTAPTGTGATGRPRFAFRARNRSGGS